MGHPDQPWYIPADPSASSSALIGGPPADANFLHSNDPWPYWRGNVGGAIGDPTPPKPAVAPLPPARPAGILGLGILPRVRAFFKF